MRLQTDLTGQAGAVGSSDNGVIVRRDGDQAMSDAMPVFRSEPGALTTLPDGVLLALDADWNEAETDAFFSDNCTELDRVSELDYIANGFFVETDPKFPSLNLANQLAALDGVAVSSPTGGRKPLRSEGRRIGFIDAARLPRLSCMLAHTSNG